MKNNSIWCRVDMQRDISNFQCEYFLEISQISMALKEGSTSFGLISTSKSATMSTLFLLNIKIKLTIRILFIFTLGHL